MNCKSTILTAALTLIGLAACSPIVDTRGNQLSSDQISMIRPGVDDKERVRRVFGSPTSTSAFDQSAWYYLSRKTETTAFLTPTIIDSQVVVVRFDPQGVVTGIEKRGPEATAQVEVSDRETPTAGHEETILQQLFGNIGRFSKTNSARPVNTTIPGR